MTDNDIVKVRRLRAENDALSKATAALAEFKRRAEARIEKLEAALRFYGEGPNYINPHCWNSWPCHGSPIDKDGGKKAREALEEK